MSTVPAILLVLTGLDGDLRVAHGLRHGTGAAVVETPAVSEAAHDGAAVPEGPRADRGGKNLRQTMGFPVEYGGFHGHGGTPMAGWFTIGKYHLEMDDDWGYPYFRKPP